MKVDGWRVGEVGLFARERQTVKRRVAAPGLRLEGCFSLCLWGGRRKACAADVDASFHQEFTFYLFGSHGAWRASTLVGDQPAPGRW